MNHKLKACGCLSLAAISVVAAIAAVFSLAQITVANDQKLVQADDAHRERMIARACEPRGKLWREPDSGEYACIYSNPDGQALVQAIPNAPYLDVVQEHAGRLVARK